MHYTGVLCLIRKRQGKDGVGGGTSEWQWGPSADTPPGGGRLLRVQGDAEDLVGVRVKGTFGLGLGLGLG